MQKSLNSAISVSRNRTITSCKHNVNVKWRKYEYIPGFGFGFAINTKKDMLKYKPSSSGSVGYIYVW